jgi:hypothetical protein
MSKILVALALLAAVVLGQGLVQADQALAAETRLIAKQVVVLERGADFIRTKVGVFRVNNATRVTVLGTRRIRFIDLTTPCLAMIKYEPQDRSEPILSEIEVIRTLSLKDLQE